MPELVNGVTAKSLNFLTVFCAMRKMQISIAHLGAGDRDDLQSRYPDGSGPKAEIPRLAECQRRSPDQPCNINRRVDHTTARATT
jgi:hypothetical protein